MPEIKILSLEEILMTTPKREVFKAEGKPTVSADIWRQDGEIVLARNITKDDSLPSGK